MAYLQHNQIGVEDKTVRVTIPNNDVARLMYYLNCVCYTIDYDENDINRYKNYQNWTSLSNEDVRVLLVLCLTLSPDVFNNKIFFQSDALCKDLGNRFYEITQVRNQLLAVESIVVAGRNCQVNKIMTYKMAWMRTYYLEPIQRLAERIKNQRQAAARPNTARKSSSCVIS